MFNSVENKGFIPTTAYDGAAPIQEYGTAKSNYSVFPLPIDDRYRLYHSVRGTADSNLEAIKNWPALSLFYTGCAKSVAIAEVVITRKLELLAEPEDFASRMSQLPAPLNNTQMEGIASVRHSIASNGESVKVVSGQTASQALVNHISNHVSKVATATGEMLSGKLLTMAEEAITNF
jgi:hypothetical protein